MKRMKLKHWLAPLLAILLLGAETSVFAAEAEPAWQAKIGAINSYAWFDVHDAGAAKIVYVRTTTTTPVSPSRMAFYEALKAYDKDTGEVRWSFTFRSPKGNSSPQKPAEMVYAPNGTVYAMLNYESGEKKLYSIQASGKINWIVDVPITGRVYRLDNGSVLAVSDAEQDQKHFNMTKIFAYSPAGKLLYKQQIRGEVLWAGRDRIVVNATNPQKEGELRIADIEVYDTSMKRQYIYRYPANGGLVIEEKKLLLMDNGILLLRAEGTNQADELSALDPKGKLLWKRSIPQNSAVQNAGNYYGVLDGRKLESYSIDNKLAASTVLEGTNLPINDMEVTPEGKLWIPYQESSYVLEPSTLKVLYQLPSFAKNGYFFSYAGNGVVFSADWQKLSKFIFESTSK